VKQPPKRLVDAAVKAGALSLDSYNCAPYEVHRRFFDKAQEAYARVARAMEATPDQEMTVFAGLHNMALKLPRRILKRGKDF
jgi:hypothetical protein